MTTGQILVICFCCACLVCVVLYGRTGTQIFSPSEHFTALLHTTFSTPPALHASNESNSHSDAARISPFAHLSGNCSDNEELCFFPAPRATVCKEEDHWQASPNEFFTPVTYPRMKVARNICVCTGSGEDFRWLFSNNTVVYTKSPFHGGSTLDSRPCTINGNAVFHDGVSLVGAYWPFHVGHQAENILPMIQLCQRKLAHRMLYLNPQKTKKFIDRAGMFQLVPFTEGLLRATGYKFQTISVEVGIAHCFDTFVPFPSPQSFWRSMRLSWLIPQSSGQLVVPTSSSAAFFWAKVMRYCSEALDTHVGKKLSTGRVIIRRGPSPRKLGNLDDVLRVFRRHLGVASAF